MPWSQFEWLETENLIAVQSKNGCCVWFSIISQKVGSQVLLQSLVVWRDGSSSQMFPTLLLLVLSKRILLILFPARLLFLPRLGWFQILFQATGSDTACFRQSKDMSLEDVIKSKGLVFALDWNQVKLNPWLFGMHFVFRNCQIVMTSPFLRPFL